MEGEKNPPHIYFAKPKHFVKNVASKKYPQNCGK